jgi:hypothetical protein
MAEESERRMHCREDRDVGGLLIPAGLFIGLGIGLLVGRPDVGVLAGLGAGFLGLAFVRAREVPVEVHVPSRSGDVLMILIGIMFVIAAIGLVYFPFQIFPYLGAAFLVLLGFWFLLRGLEGFRREKEGP